MHAICSWKELASVTCYPNYPKQSMDWMQFVSRYKGIFHRTQIF